ncbi:hypothetical protein M3570_21660, partial [Bacillus subtilis]|nr:hypothetical protein [Bacillus subtilis]
TSFARYAMVTWTQRARLCPRTFWRREMRWLRRCVGGKDTGQTGVDDRSEKPVPGMAGVFSGRPQPNASEGIR